MSSSAKMEPKSDTRGWENGARAKIIFHATIAHGDWWQIFNPANEMTLLARETSEARAIVDTLNSHADLVKALEELLPVVENMRGTPDEEPEEPCTELCGNSWCDQFGCIPQKLNLARTALSYPVGREELKVGL